MMNGPDNHSVLKRTVSPPERAAILAARAEASRRHADLLRGHQDVQDMLAVQDDHARDLLAHARSTVATWRVQHACDRAYLDAWDAILDHPLDMVCIIRGGMTDYLLQCSPFSDVVAGLGYEICFVPPPPMQETTGRDAPNKDFRGSRV